MIITKELLESKGACFKDIKYFDKQFPHGTEITDDAMAKLRDCPTEFIWWLYNNISKDDRLLSGYGVNKSTGVHRSDGVNRSDGVSWSNGVNTSDGVNRSDGVSWSNGVNWSDGVNLSNGVNKSTGVHRSDGVNRSNGVNWSDGVNLSNGVNKSTGVHRSDGVSWSNGVNLSNGVNWSYGVNRSDGVNLSYGVLNCSGESQSLFNCNKEQSCTVFGKPVSSDKWLSCLDNLTHALGTWKPTFNNIKQLYLKSNSDWKLTPISNAEGLSKKEAWESMPKKAIEVIKSWEEFDKDMFFEITGLE